MIRVHRLSPILVVGCLLVVPAANAVAQFTTRISVSSSGDEADGRSENPAVSADGRCVAFASWADNLVGGDNNGWIDVFVHDRETGLIERVSVDSAGAQDFAYSDFPSISADGRYVAFESEATLVAGDTNFAGDIYIRDRDTSTTVRVSVSTNGVEANDWCFAPMLSADGRFVTYYAFASNLVDDDEGFHTDIFVHDRDADEDGIFDEPGQINTSRASVTESGVQGNDSSWNAVISANGRWVAFDSEASNLTPGDTNGANDIFVKDLTNGAVTRVSVGSNNELADDHSRDPWISDDGRHLVFRSEATNLISAGDNNGFHDVYVHDRDPDSNGVFDEPGLIQTTLMSFSLGMEPGNGTCLDPIVTSDGRFVAFMSQASDLIDDDTNFTNDVFLVDRDADDDGVLDEFDGMNLERISHSTGGAQGNGVSNDPAFSSDGRWVAFESEARNMVSGDSNLAMDIFVRDRCPAPSWETYGNGFPGTLGVPALTGNGVPKIGGSLSTTLENSLGADTIALLFLGAADAALPTNKGGVLLVEPLLTLVLQVPVNGINLATSLAEDSNLCGVELFLQALESDAGAEFGVSFTAGLKGQIGGN